MEETAFTLKMHLNKSGIVKKNLFLDTFFLCLCTSKTEPLRKEVERFRVALYLDQPAVINVKDCPASAMAYSADAFKYLFVTL